MPYLALARKYRPQDFDAIVGQEHVTRTLKRAVATNRIHHAYLFTGIRGVGKTTAARVLAKALNCQEGPRPDPCGKCTSCLEITRGNSMDVLELDAASNRGIDNIRDLCDTVRYSTARDRFRVVIIDEVHMLTDQAFNALLKTLEEPPPHVCFILATTDPQKIPPTVLSRCQRFDFRRVETRELLTHLQWICKEESIDADEEALRAIIREGSGSVRDSIGLLDQLIASSEGGLTFQTVADILGLAPRAAVFETVGACLAADAATALTVLRDLHIQGMDLKAFFLELLDSFRDLLVLKLATAAASQLVDRSAAETRRLQELAGARSAFDLNAYFKTTLEGIARLTSSDSPRYAAEELLLRLCLIRKTEDLGLLIKRLDGLARGLGDVPAEEPPAPPTPPAPAPAEKKTEPAAAPVVSPEPPALPGRDDPLPAPSAPIEAEETETTIDLDEPEGAAAAEDTFDRVGTPSFAELEEDGADLRFLHWLFRRDPVTTGLLTTCGMRFLEDRKELLLYHPEGEGCMVDTGKAGRLLSEFRGSLGWVVSDEATSAPELLGLAVTKRLEAQRIRKRDESLERIRASVLMKGARAVFEIPDRSIRINLKD